MSSLLRASVGERRNQVRVIVSIESVASRAPGAVRRHRQPNSGTSSNPVPLGDVLSGQAQNLDSRAPSAEHGTLRRGLGHVVVRDGRMLDGGAYPGLGAAIEHATITDNDVTMSAPEGAVLGARSAGIEILGLARENIAQRNRIRGRARVGLSMASDSTGSPAGNTFDRNDHANLISPLADGGTQQ